MKRPWVTALWALVLLPARLCATDVYIGVEALRGSGQLALGLAAFEPEDPKRPQDAATGLRLRQVLRDDLLFSRYFQVLEPEGAPSGEDAGKWRELGASFLLLARVTQLESRISLSVKLKDLASGQTLLERYYRQDQAYWRSLPHRVADDVLRQLTGKTGVAQTQLAFANDQSGSKEIYLVDYDGENLRRLTMNRSLNLLPRWSPDKNRVAFTSYKAGNPDLYLFDLARGGNKTLSSRQGLNLPGGFSPDGSQLAATLSDQKNPNIYLLSLQDGSLQRVTSHFGVESSPTYSPDGAYLAFVSNRAGNPDIHILELATERLRRLTRLNWCDGPAWSPSGEWIAFSGRANPKDRMDIFLVDVTGTRLVQLTHSEGSNEDPSWSPDSRFIAFTSNRSGRRQLYLMDADGSAPHPIGIVPGNSFTPHWSPAP